MSNIITINVNGNPYSCKDTMTLSALITYLSFNPQLVAVEHNHEVIPGNSWSSISIKDKDHIEIVTIVGGGSNILC